MAGLALRPDDRFLVGTGDNEDAAVLRFPEGKALVQTVDFLTPIVNDPYKFGRIAAANALSDVFAMGGEPWSAMNIVCFPVKSMSKDVLTETLRGGYDAILEAGAVLAGGHSVEDDEFKYGLSVSGTIDPDHMATNKGLRVGDQLLLTKPIGTGVLATAVKGRWENSAELEELLYTWAARLNKAGAEAIREFRLLGATDITGFGLGGHVLEMARASKVAVELWPAKAPFLDGAEELASMGLIPAGSFANKSFCNSVVNVGAGLNAIQVDLMFDAQTSGGLVLSVPKDRFDDVSAFLLERGDLAAHVGEVVPQDSADALLALR